ncbi:MAG: hypothetical protein HOQ43_10875 [Glycomyces artemisiae]|uniref:Uncharacterized protein n=1 Tax=Glycomyces artemisiae TaxID=1076443 RepID=A0A850CA38_9ACTN|nr:hypothetical protein [Glycomyces artemisiae]
MPLPKTRAEREAYLAERKRLAAEKKAASDAKIQAAKDKRSAARADAAAIPGQMREAVADAWAEGQAAGQPALDAAKARQQELYDRRDELKAELDEKLKTRNILGFKRRKPRD